MRSSLTALKRAVMKIVSLLGTLFLLGLSLLPLSALLLAYPAINPQEAIDSDEVNESRSRLSALFRRMMALIAGFSVLVVILAVSVEMSSSISLPDQGQFGRVAEWMLPAPKVVLGKTERERSEKLESMSETTRDYFETPLHERLPQVMVQHWPVIILAMYLIDLVILVFIGKVPLAYNLRNIRVRWVTNLMTMLAFTFVIWLLVFLLAFVNGMNNLTENSGIPGNVFVLSDGATDELFSNLGYGDIDNVERAVAEYDLNNNPLANPVRIRSIEKDGRRIYLASKETYYVINQPIPNSDPPRRRFVQLRTVDDPYVAEMVHDVKFYAGGRWFSDAGVDSQSRIECVLGEGVAGTLGADLGKPRLEPGDTFELGDMEWVVTGIMKTEGTTFGSEIWAKRINRITKPFGKESFTTLVLRTDQDTSAASKIFAHHLSTRYTQQKLKAFSEPDYYAELTKTNNDFLVATIIVALVMSVGGIFGMMTTMFASINQRIRDIGVLRLLGFKRWQVMVSFMLESLTVALIGGMLGCSLAWLSVDGKESVSTLSSGGGGPGGKSVALSIDVDFQVVALGLLFTLVMGRLGGLVPALSAMKIKVLDSLR